MRRLPAILTALLLGLSSAYAVACGEEREGLIGPNRADRIKEHLDGLDDAVAKGQCEQRAPDEIRNVREEVAKLPESTDPELRRRLRDGAEHLARIAPGDCEENRPETTPTETDTTPTQTETTPTETTPPPTETTPPTATTPPPTETTPPPTETTPPEPPPDEPPVSPPGGEEAPGDAQGAVP